VINDSMYFTEFTSFLTEEADTIIIALMSELVNAAAFCSGVYRA